MPGRCLPLVAAGLLAAAPAWGAEDAAAPVEAELEGAAAAQERWTWAIGASIGLPQLPAVTGERSLLPVLRAQANLGTVVVVSAVNVRLLALPEAWTLQPYAFLGGGAAYAFPIDDDLNGTYAYSWTGWGLRLALRRVIVFGEFSLVGGAEDLFGPGAGAGILVRFH